MSGTTRITVASLAAQVAAQQAQTDATLLGLTSLVERLIGVVGAQHNTPAAVVEITSAPSVKASVKASKKAAPKVAVPAPAPAKKAMPAELKEGFALVRETKSDIQPLNKALARLNPGAWVKATERSVEQINAALADVAERDGVAVAQAALEAFKVRAEAAAKRK